ncbi:MAG: SDR family NAD(P)-dependent oxidoreductase [Bacteroidetes bacterium]|nr:MAG: SDR family NAD(P)-dependent oxidoreductase [Bacteroidota bacterium]
MNFSAAEKQRLISQYGPWAVVTGASSGIGRELAERLAEAGMHLVLSARRENLLEDLAQSLRSRYHRQVQVVASDLSSAEGQQKLLKATENQDIGLLVAAAGFGTSGLLTESSPEEELNMLDLNCGAVYVLSHAFGRRLAARGRGGIILMSSIVAFQGVPYSAHYAATKAYNQSLAEALAVELKPLGVDVLAAAPATVDSGFASRANMKLSGAMSPAEIGVETLKALGRKTVVFPGLLSKLLTFALTTVPRWAKVQIMKQVMGGFTKHQRT